MEFELSHLWTESEDSSNINTDTHLCICSFRLAEQTAPQHNQSALLHTSPLHRNKRTLSTDPKIICRSVFAFVIMGKQCSSSESRTRDLILFVFVSFPNCVSDF